MSRAARLVAVAALPVGLLGCSGTATLVTPLDLVPADAIVVSELRFRIARASRTLRPLTNSPQWPAELSKLGLSIDDLDTVVAFARSIGSTGLREASLLVGNAYGVRLEQMSKINGWSRQAVDRHILYLIPGQAGTVAAVLNEDLVAVGPRNEVEHLLGSLQTIGGFVSKPELDGVTDALRDESAVRLAVVWPENVSDASKAAVAASASVLGLAGYETAGSVLKQLGIGRAYVARMRPESAGVRVDLTGVLDDEATATMVAGSLSLLNGIAGLAQGGSTGMTIKRTGSVVSVAMTLPDNAFRR